MSTYVIFKSLNHIIKHFLPFFRSNLKVDLLRLNIMAVMPRNKRTMTKKTTKMSVGVWQNVKCSATSNSSANWANLRYYPKTFFIDVSKNCWLGARVKILPRISNAYARSCGRAVVSWTPTRVT